MDELRALRYFAKVAESGSFTLTAESFSVPPSSVSRRVSELEQKLGATLLQRSTRTVRLTEVGSLYLERVQEAMEVLQQGEEAVRAYQSKPVGQLKISAMAGLGERMVIPLLRDFASQFPEVVLDVSLSDEVVSLGVDDVDIAIRGGYAPNERIHAVRLMDNEFVPVASPDYLKAEGHPGTVFDLVSRRGLFYRTPRGPTPWLCEVDGEWHDVSGITAAVSNDGVWLGDLAVQGKGILMAPRWSLRDHLKQGTLVELKLDTKLFVSENTELAIYLLYQKRRYHVPKIKAAVDFFVEHLKEG